MRLHFGLVALFLCIAQTAMAQKVVVLEFEGDKGGKLRAKVEAALKKAKVVDVVPIAKWKDAATKKKLKGAQAMTPSAVARVAAAVGIDAAVEGALGDTFFVRILDPEGSELWSKDLKLTKGLISDDHAKKLAKAIAAAAKAGPAPKAEPEKPKEEPEKPKKKPKEETTETTEGEGEGGESGEEGTEETPTPRRPVIGGGNTAEEEAEARAAQAAVSSPEPEKDRDLDTEGVKKVYTVRPKVIWLWLAGSTTGRSYCSRPGVDACADYDRLPENERPVGDTVEFSPNVPYAGFLIGLEVFPLSTLWDKMGGFGFGLMGEFGLGFSLTNVKIQLPTGATDEQQVVSTDRSWEALFALRWNISFGEFQFRGVNHIGLHAGFGGHTFEIDAAANVPLPGPDRAFPIFGAHLYIQPVKWAGLKFGLSLFPAATPGGTVLVGYSKCTIPAGGGACEEAPPNGSAESFGVRIEGGLRGELIGPLGYYLSLRYESFGDKFYGEGKKWTTPCDSTTFRCGGADQEQYFKFLWGLTGSF
jgi:hypothetical protein